MDAKTRQHIERTVPSPIRVAGRWLRCGGVPSKLYHLSPEKFNAFKQQYQGGSRASDVGFHFGTRQTALNRSVQLQRQGQAGSGDTVYMYTVKLDARKPLKLSENRLGSWSVNSILIALFDNPPPGVTEEMQDARWDDEIMLPNGENLLDMATGPEYLAIDGLTEWLGMIGYDSFEYINTYEGGGTSYMVLRPEQVRITNVEPMVIP